MKILYIKSAEHEKLEFDLFIDNKVIKISRFVQMGTMADKFLPILDKFLTKNKISLNNLNAIAVYAGPGSYTSLRIGLSVANALAFSLDIPVFGLKKTEEFSKKFSVIIADLIKQKTFIKPVNAYYQQAIN